MYQEFFLAQIEEMSSGEPRQPDTSYDVSNNLLKLGQVEILFFYALIAMRKGDTKKAIEIGNEAFGKDPILVSNMANGKSKFYSSLPVGTIEDIIDKSSLVYSEEIGFEEQPK